VDPDLIFNTVLKCYPEKSKLGAGMKFNIDEYDPEGWLEATKHLHWGYWQDAVLLDN
jgi:hypothetical protein